MKETASQIEITKHEPKARLNNSLWLVVGVAILGHICAYGTFPSIFEIPSFSNGNDTRFNRNFFGQGITASLWMSVPLLLLIYFVKWDLIRRYSKSEAVCGYFWLMVASLPYIWFVISTGWENPFINRICCWIGDPILVLTIPTMTFIIDLRSDSRKSIPFYLLRSIGELIFLIPSFGFCWLQFQRVIHWIDF